MPHRQASDLPISVKTSTTPSPVFALVSKKSRPLSRAYSSASSRETWRLPSPTAGAASAASSSSSSPSAAGVAVALSSSSSSEAGAAASSAESAAPGWTRSSLLPARAMTMLRVEGREWVSAGGWCGEGLWGVELTWD